MATRSESASNTSRRGHLVAAHRAISLYPAEDSCLHITSGRAWVTGTHQHMLDPSDPWPAGYRVADTWPMKAKRG